MAKIQPLPTATSSSSSYDHRQGQRSKQAYTVWMKSLVFNGNSCAVYGPDGNVAFRVDNYGCRGGREVFFMDRAGNALIRIRRKGFGMFRRWEVCRCVHQEATPLFTVRKREYKVRGVDGAAVAEVTRKQTSTGVVLGEDVLTLTVASEMDHLLTLGLVVVRGLINRSLWPSSSSSVSGLWKNGMTVAWRT
ncbi:hypothetical protein VPH35_055088 [Triticum aestivum]